MLSKKRNGWLWVVMLFAVCAVVYGMLSSYPRELAVYSDELRYLDVARSLLQGRGLRVRNMPSDYQKILYPLCILPALLLRTTAAQITAIMALLYGKRKTKSSPSPWAALSDFGKVMQKAMHGLPLRDLSHQHCHIVPRRFLPGRQG